MGDDGVCIELVSPHHKGSLGYDLVVGLPTLLFVAYLALTFRPSIRKLQRSQSLLMFTYYSMLWFVCVLNILRCLIQLLGAGSAGTSWNIFWLLTRFGMVLLEVSVVVFLMQGYQTSGPDALRRTLLISGGIATAGLALKAVYIWGFHVPLFLYGGPYVDAHHPGDQAWSKWSFWLMHALVFGLVYAALLVLPLTRWRDLLPAKPSFYRYVLALAGLNGLLFLGATLIGAHAGAGYCLYGVANSLYYALYPPLLYLTFLHEFFADDDLDLDMMYYSEMREAGCFEDF